MKALKRNKMGENHHHGPVGAVLSLFFGFLSFITLKDFQTWVSICAGFAGIGAACFTIIHYIKTWREKSREKIQQNKAA